MFEEAPVVPMVDTALNRIGDPHALEEALAGLDRAARAASEVSAVSAPLATDDTLDRAPVAPARDIPWTISGLAAAPAAGDDWVVTNVAEAVRAIEPVNEDSGSVTQLQEETPADRGRRPAPTPSAPIPLAEDPWKSSTAENAFVAGEIDVPTPNPATQKQEFTAASTLLGNVEQAADPDTGSRTPALERRDRDL